MNRNPALTRVPDRAGSGRHMSYLPMWRRPDRNAEPWRAALARPLIDARRRIDREIFDESREPPPPLLRVASS